MLSPLAAFIYATRHFTVRLPYITEEPKAWLKLWLKLNRSARGLAGTVFTANLVAAMAVTTMEFKEIANISLKLDEFEQQMEQEGKVEEKVK
jgi:transmembrane protein 126A